MINMLLIEDNEEDYVTTKRALKLHLDQTYNLYHAQTLREALALLKCLDAIDVILLDLGLPDTTGPKDTFKKIAHVIEAIPIVILSANEDHDLALKIVDSGAEDYIKKSSLIAQPKLLCDAIDFSIHRHQYNKALASNKNDLLEWVTGRYSVASSA